MTRIARLLGPALAVLVVAGTLQAQSVDVYLDLFYNDPDDTSSAGSWQLIASASDEGLAGLNARLTGVNDSPIFAAPTGDADMGGPAGLQAGFNTEYDDDGTIKPFDTDQDGDGDTLEMLFGQVPVDGGPQGLFYGVGTEGGFASPDDAGHPALNSLTNTSNVPWNLDDDLGDLLGDADFEDGVLMAFGTFEDGSSPDFAALATQANVFTSVGTTSDPGDIPQAQGGNANVSTNVRSTAGATLPGDANLDGTVGLIDLSALAGGFDQQGLWQNGDFSGDNNVGLIDLSILAGNFDQSVGGGGLSAAAVPEPASMIVVAVLALMAGLVGVKRRFC